MTSLTDRETILDALDIGALTPEEQEDLLLDLNSLVFRGTLVRLIERMDDAARDDFAKLMDTSPDEEAVEAFLRARVPDADSAVADTLADLTDDIVAVTNANQ